MRSPGRRGLLFALALTLEAAHALMCSKECALRITTLEAEVRELQIMLAQINMGSGADTEHIVSRKMNLVQGNREVLYII